mgnify:FL=1
MEMLKEFAARLIGSTSPEQWSPDGKTAVFVSDGGMWYAVTFDSALEIVRIQCSEHNIDISFDSEVV